MPGTSLSSDLGGGVSALLTTPEGLVIFATSKGVPAATAGVYVKGALILRLDTGALLHNTGTTAAPVLA